MLTFAGINFRGNTKKTINLTRSSSGLKSRIKSAVGKILSPKKTSKTQEKIEKDLQVLRQKQNLTKEYLQMVETDFGEFQKLSEKGEMAKRKNCGYLDSEEDSQKAYEKYLANFQEETFHKKESFKSILSAIKKDIEGIKQEIKELKNLTHSLEGGDVARGEEKLKLLEKKMKSLLLEKQGMEGLLNKKEEVLDYKSFLRDIRKDAGTKRRGLYKKTLAYSHIYPDKKVTISIESPLNRVGYYLEPEDFKAYHLLYERLKSHISYISSLSVGKGSSVSKVSHNYLLDNLGKEENNVLYFRFEDGIIGIAFKNYSCECGNDSCINTRNYPDIENSGYDFKISALGLDGIEKYSYKNKQKRDVAYKLLKIGKKIASTLPKTISRVKDSSIKDSKRDLVLFGSFYKYKADIM